MRKWSLVAAWVVVVALATTLTWQIVSAADAQVSDRPVAPLQVAAPLSSASGPTTSTQGEPVSSSAPTASTTVTSVPGSETQATAGTSASTVAEAGWSSRTISTGGGVVVVSYRPDEVVLNAATPAPGFAVEVKKGGPPEVEVEFVSETARYQIRARWEQGQLAVDTGSEAGDDDEAEDD